MTFENNPSKLKVAVLASGNGSNLQVLIDAMQAGALPISIVGVISNVKDAHAITRAKQAHIETATLSHIVVGEHVGKRMGIKTFERHASEQLSIWQPDLIVLAGFMRVLSDGFIASACAPIINLHPSLLPKYKGLDTHQRVLESEDKLHGCSVHVVTKELDAGQVLTQSVLYVSKEDTPDRLQQRVRALEHQIVPWTILLIAKGVLDIAKIAASSELPNSSCLPTLPYKLLSNI